MRIEHAGERIGVSHGAADRTHADRTGQTSGDLRHVAGGLLVADIDDPHVRVTAGIQEGGQAVPVERGDPGDVARHQLLDHDIRYIH